MKIALQTLASAAFGIAFLAVSLFVPAGTLSYWQAWVFIAVFIASTIVPSIYLAVHDPAALQRRMTAGPAAESRPLQRIVISATVVLVMATFVVAALDHRFGWSSVPAWLVPLGDVLVAAGLLLAQLVVVQNGYASANITVEQDQPLVSTGLYGVVRHPMYFGALVMLIGTPLALDSFWALLAVAAAVPVLAARITDEEKMLREELAGYVDYSTRVRSRLIPGVW
ncbi:methyltransferase family protein [Mycolicibacterium sediminis]|uniref:Membrane protein n=1 Tax=Mycolicibacterium sediminis TaxID=1286180 RepID=A0A7I7QXZ5_9MYCO|nr:isoprenylcysteine carboxylmethyltransferase family protein [Mycolicibacterium sediminis]BBY31253.1 membrane protein [Mycolicibacterium sediminis]